MSTYYTLLTRIGAALHANAQVNQTTVPWTHMRLGDGGGAPVVPTENQKGLVRQVHTLAITDIAIHPDNPNWVIAEAVVPSDVGGWTVRETAIYGGADGSTCIAVGNYPETYKPVLAEGAGREMVMRMVVQISSVATVKLEIDPAVAIASRAWVESLKATPEKAGLVELATVQEHLDGLEGRKAATPEGVKAMVDRIRGLPIFYRGIHDGTRAGLLRLFGGMATPDDGLEISALTHPEVVKGVLRGDVASCTEAEWLADPYKRGMWSRGTAYLDGQGNPQGWVRTSDRNGVYDENSLPAPFWRGGADAKVGSIGKDTMRNLFGEAGQVLAGENGFSNPSPSGVLKKSSRQIHGATSSGTTSRSYSTLIFDASDALPEGHVTDSVNGEFAPWHIFGVSYTITSNGVVNEAAINAAEVMGEVFLLQGAVNDISAVAVLEPTGGAISVGATVEWANPFPGHIVNMRVFLQVDGKWCETKWGDANISSGHGVSALQRWGGGDDIIVLRAGSSSLMNNTAYLANSAGRTTALTAATPCKVYVEKTKGVQ